MAAELPPPVARACAALVHALDTTAEGLLEGLYLRGSVALDDFAPRSDIDMTVVLTRRPNRHDLMALEAAHTQVWFELPEHDVDAHHVLLEDLRRRSDQCPLVPCTHGGTFVAEGRRDLDPVAWCELAWHGVRVAGREPGVLGIHADADELRAHTARRLAGWWGRTARELTIGWPLAGRRDESVTVCTLGVARLHHLLATGTMTSTGGAGNYVLERLDERWHPLATEALRIRQQPGSRSCYRSAAQRGKDLRDFVAWCVADGAALARGISDDPF